MAGVWDCPEAQRVDTRGEPDGAGGEWDGVCGVLAGVAGGGEFAGGVTLFSSSILLFELSPEVTPDVFGHPQKSFDHGRVELRSCIAADFFARRDE